MTHFTRHTLIFQTNYEYPKTKYKKINWNSNQLNYSMTQTRKNCWIKTWIEGIKKDNKFNWIYVLLSYVINIVSNHSIVRNNVLERPSKPYKKWFNHINAENRHLFFDDEIYLTFRFIIRLFFIVMIIFVCHKYYYGQHWFFVRSDMGSTTTTFFSP